MSDPSLSSLFLEACEDDDLSAMAEFIDLGLDINAEISSVRALPLQCAVSLDASQMLLEMGADPNAKTWHGESPMLLACRDNELDIVRLYERFGGDFAKLSGHGSNCLHKCAAGGAAGVMQYILDKGLIDIDARAKKVKKTPLHFASYFGHLDCVSLLLDAGANLELRDSEGRNALDLAAEGARVDCMRLLLDRGATLAGDQLQKDSVLYHACRAVQPDAAFFVMDELGIAADATVAGKTLLQHFALNSSAKERIRERLRQLCAQQLSGDLSALFDEGVKATPKPSRKAGSLSL